MITASWSTDSQTDGSTATLRQEEEEEVINQSRDNEKLQQITRTDDLFNSRPIKEHTTNYKRQKDINENYLIN